MSDERRLYSQAKFFSKTILPCQLVFEVDTVSFRAQDESDKGKAVYTLGRGRGRWTCVWGLRDARGGRMGHQAWHAGRMGRGRGDVKYRDDFF